MKVRRVGRAEQAIGGFVLYNDFTARDEQWKQTRRGVFGLEGTVTVNGGIGSSTYVVGSRA